MNHHVFDMTFPEDFHKAREGFFQAWDKMAGDEEISKNMAEELIKGSNDAMNAAMVGSHDKAIQIYKRMTALLKGIRVIY